MHCSILDSSAIYTSGKKTCKTSIGIAIFDAVRVSYSETEPRKEGNMSLWIMIFCGMYLYAMLSILAGIYFSMRAICRFLRGIDERLATLEKTVEYSIIDRDLTDHDLPFENAIFERYKL